MGEQDVAKLMEIYKYLLDYCRENQYNYQFIVDLGKYETAIEFMQEGKDHCYPPLSQLWKDVVRDGHTVLVPDILDYDNRIIIEYEEETGKREHGAKLATKGHGHPGDLANKRDSNKFKFYKNGKFRCFRLWESNQEWKKDLAKFITVCISQDNANAM